MGLKRWAWQRKALVPTAKAWRATRSGDFVVMLMRHYTERS